MHSLVRQSCVAGGVDHSLIALPSLTSPHHLHLSTAPYRQTLCHHHAPTCIPSPFVSTPSVIESTSALRHSSTQVVVSPIISPPLTKPRARF